MAVQPSTAIVHTLGPTPNTLGPTPDSLGPTPRTVGVEDTKSVPPSTAPKGKGKHPILSATDLPPHDRQKVTSMLARDMLRVQTRPGQCIARQTQTVMDCTTQTGRSVDYRHLHPRG